MKYIFKLKKAPTILGSLKGKVDKLDVDKLKPITVGLKKVSVVAE